MAKKKAARTKPGSRTKKKVRAASKKTASKKTASKKATRKKRVKKKVAKQKTVAKKRKAPATKRAKTTKKKKKSGKAKSLGRPRVTVDVKLDQLFQKDYQAREIFEFLRVNTIRELEQFAPDEIIDRLVGPVIQAVQRIRKAMAMNNRCLAKDRDFAVEFQALLKRE